MGRKAIYGEAMSAAERQAKGRIAKQLAKDETGRRIQAALDSLAHFVQAGAVQEVVAAGIRRDLQAALEHLADC